MLQGSKESYGSDSDYQSEKSIAIGYDLSRRSVLVAASVFTHSPNPT